jgi:hypothetical protein
MWLQSVGLSSWVLALLAMMSSVPIACGGPVAPQPEPPKSFVGKLWANPLLRLLSIILIAFLTVGLISLGIFGIRRQESQAVVRLTITPRPTRTFTITVPPSPTNTRVVRSATPTFIGPTHLWMFLDETYTPTPLYVNTPHPVIEAYRAALRAFERNDYQNMLAFMQQASRDDPNSPDFTISARSTP